MGNHSKQESHMNDPMRITPATAGGSTADESVQSDDAYRRARRRVRMLRGWQIHALVYVCVIATLWLVYGFTGQSRFPWPMAPTLGWGLGLGIHGLVVWLGTSRKSRDWEERKIEQYMKEDMASRAGGRR
jgi:hypothetical protein